MKTSDVLAAHVRGQLIAITNICAILLATHPDTDEIMPIVRNLAKAARTDDSAADREICAGIAEVLSRIEIIVAARVRKDGLIATRTKPPVKAN